MEIVIGGIPSVQKEPSKENAHLHAGKKMVRKDRRKTKQDRRKGVRDGILVSFSGRDDRRVQRDRRRVSC